MRKVLWIGTANTIRFVRDRSNLFFVFVFPLVIVLLIGVAFGGGFDARVGVHVAGERGEFTDSLVGRLDALDDIEVVEFEGAGGMVDAVERGRVDGGLLIPDGYEAGIAAGEVVSVEFVARPDQSAQLMIEAVREAVADEARPVRAARFAASLGLGTFGDLYPTAVEVADGSERITVEFREAGEPLFEGLEDLGAFDLGATQELALFMFLTSLAASADLILTRRLGVARRMLSTPTSTFTILLGEAAGRLSVGMVQGLYIMAGTLLIFRVDWGDPLGAVALVVTFALIGAGAAMLMGAIFSNEQQAGGLGVLIGLGVAAFGGAMVPVEIFPDTLATAARFTPHYWMIDGFAELVRRDGTFVDIVPHLGVLLGFAAGFLLLATWRLHRVLTR